MIKQIGIVLGAVICCNASLYTMYEDKFFAKTAGDVVVPFDKNLLPHMKTLETIHKDFPATEALGSLDNPFPLENVTADDLQKVLSFLLEKERHTYLQQRIQKKESATQESVERDILKFINTFLSNGDTPKLEAFTQLIRATDYLDIDLLSVLKKYPSAMTESVEDALKAGLQKINKLEGDLLNAIKNEFIKTLCHQVEKKWERERNVRIIPLEGQQFPANYNYTDTYMKRPHKSLDLIYSSTGSVITKHSKVIGGIFTENRQLILPPYQHILQLPHQELIAREFAQQRILSQRVPFPGRDAHTNIYFSPDDTYCVFSFYVGPRVYGATRVWGPKGVITDLPMSTTFFSAFIDEEGKEKLVAIVWDSGLEQKEKIVIIDPSNGACSIAAENDIRTRVACMVSNTPLLIRNGVGYRTGPGEKSIFSLELFDCKAKKIKTSIPGADDYMKLISWVDDDKTIKLAVLRDIVVNSVRKCQIDVYVIDSTASNISLVSERIVPSNSTIIYCEEVSSKYIVINFDNFKNLQHADIVSGQEHIYVTGYYTTGNTLPVFSIFNKKFAKKRMDGFKNLTILSIEQLYMLKGIMDRINKNAFLNITPTEKKLFDEMPIPVQNFFHEFFGVAFTEIYSTRSIINIKKAVELEAPLPGYVKQTHGGVKRPAQGPTEELRPAKKRKTEPVESEEESEAEDETTMDESEENSEEDKE